MIALIAAMTEDRIIGKNGSIPWHISEDLALFKRQTLGSIIIMGRKTFESLGRPLSGRHNIVVSGSLSPLPGIDVLPNLEEALTAARRTGKDIYLIGGASVYREGLLYADTLFLSLVKGSYTGDTRFPDFDKNVWTCTEKTDFPGFTFTVWKKTSPPGS